MIWSARKSLIQTGRFLSTTRGASPGTSALRPHMPSRARTRPRRRRRGSAARRRGAHLPPRRRPSRGEGIFRGGGFLAFLSLAIARDLRRGRHSRPVALSSSDVSSDSCTRKVAAKAAGSTARRASGGRPADQAVDQRAEIDPRVLRRLRQEALGREAGQRVDLQQVRVVLRRRA